MNIARRFLLTLVITVFSLSTARAQTRPVERQRPTPLVAATASADKVHYVSIGEVHQTRLQVFSSEGAQVYDSGLRLGNLIDWKLENQQGTRLVDGAYLYLITVKDFSNVLTQKYGVVVLEQGQVYLEQGSRDALAPAHQTALEANRLSEVVSGVDRVGAAGLSRTSTTGATEATAATTSIASGTGESASAPENLGGSGNQNQIAKWIDNAGTLGDSIMFDNGSGVGVGTMDLTDVLVAGNDKFKVVDGPMTFSFRDFAGGQGYFAIGSSANGIKGFIGHTNTADGFTLGTFSNHKLTIRTNSLNRLVVDATGNVGIGTNPMAKLHVAGNVNFTGFRTEVTLTSPNVIGGASDNAVSAGIVGATIGGGGRSATGSESSRPNRVTDNYGTVGGGMANTAGDPAGPTNGNRFATVGGGFSNTASGGVSTVGGGQDNTASGLSSTVGGGHFNTASRDYSTVGGGFFNTASGGGSTVGGGTNNTASGEYSTVPGGTANVAQGYFSYAAGLRAKALHQGSFVWSDSTTIAPGYFSSTANDQFLINATGGVGIGTNAPLAKLEIRGGADSNGLNDPKALAFSWHGGGFRHFVRTRHNATASRGNAIDFFVNNSSSAEGSSAPFTGNQQVMTLDGLGVGLGTMSPGARFHVVAGDMAVTTPGFGVILRATDGTNCYRLTVNNVGALSTAGVACPP